jgi:hypothetical protein
VSACGGSEPLAGSLQLLAPGIVAVYCPLFFLSRVGAGLQNIVDVAAAIAPRSRLFRERILRGDAGAYLGDAGNIFDLSCIFRGAIVFKCAEGLYEIKQ